MQFFIRSILFLMFFALSVHADTSTKLRPWFVEGSAKGVEINVDVFLSSSCPHCQKAEHFFKQMQQKNPWLNVDYHIINQDKAALKRFASRLHQLNLNNFAVPAVFFCHSHWLGFDSDETTGASLMHSIKFCRNQITAQGDLMPATMRALQARGASSLFQLDSRLAKNHILFTPMLALIDATTPCSLFGMVVFLSFLWCFSNSRKQQLLYGGAYILALGFTHFFSQGFVSWYFIAVEWMRIPAIVIGISLLFLVLNEKKKWFDLVRARYVLVMITACTVYIYQQTCQLNTALIFYQWIEHQSFSFMQRTIHMVVYQVFYLLPPVIFLLCYIALGQSQYIVRYHRVLQLSGSLILLSVGCLLLIYPDMLASSAVSVLLVVCSLAIGGVIDYYNKIDDEKR